MRHFSQFFDNPQEETPVEEFTLEDGRSLFIPMGAMYAVLPDSVSPDAPHGERGKAA